MAKLYFRYGVMGSSKTANALMTRFNYEERGQQTLLVKPRVDTRDGDHMVVSRIGLTYPCIYFDEMRALSVMELQQNACIIVDEAQFLTKEEVMYLVYLVDDLGIPVICYGLRADFKGDLFPGSEALLVMADKLEEVKTVCWCKSPVWIAADGDRLYRVFQNLIGNALKYSLEGSRIYLELTAADGQAAAVLRNTSREELPDGVDLTERFVRGDESRTDGGSGLGLSIARTFTEACGGTFSVQTQADLFTASVSFPLTRERPPKEESAV